MRCGRTIGTSITNRRGICTLRAVMTSRTFDRRDSEFRAIIARITDSGISGIILRAIITSRTISSIIIGNTRTILWGETVVTCRDICTTNSITISTTRTVFWPCSTLRAKVTRGALVVTYFVVDNSLIFTEEAWWTSDTIVNTGLS
jgi:hypothetical protein